MTIASGAAADCDRALLYHQSRPPYALGVLDFVAERADPAVLDVVVDLGCGTGLSTLLFGEVAGTLIGIEPDPAMRTVARAWERLWVHHMGPRLGPDIEDIDGVLVPRFFGPGHHRFHRVEHHRFSEARLRQFALSSGYAPRSGEDQPRQALQEAITAFCNIHGDGGRTLAGRRARAVCRRWRT